MNRKHIIKTITLPVLGAFIACNAEMKEEDFEFGMRYNKLRREFGSPTIKQDMVPINCCDAMTVYQVDPNKKRERSFHSSKTIRAIINGKVSNEEDIFYNTINDTVYQLNVETVYNWKERKLKMIGNVGPVSQTSQWIDLKNEKGVDSVLCSWGLSRLND